MSIPPEVYDRSYFLSSCCEGFDQFEEGRGLSPLKQGEVELLDIRPGSRVLDAGCGRGEVLLACADRGAKVAGIDYAAAAVEIAKETLAEVADAEVVLGSLDELPWPDDSFDRALLGDVIEHLDAEQGVRALSELARVLRPTGLLVVHTSPNRLFLDVTWPVARRVLRLLGHRSNAEAMDAWIADSKKYHVNEQTTRSLRRMLEAAGLRPERVWLDPNVIRGGEHQLTQGLDRSAMVRLAARVASLGPARQLLSNDLYALARPAS